MPNPAGSIPKPSRGLIIVLLQLEHKSVSRTAETVTAEMVLRGLVRGVVLECCCCCCCAVSAHEAVVSEGAAHAHTAALLLLLLLAAIGCLHEYHSDQNSAGDMDPCAAEQGILACFGSADMLCDVVFAGVVLADPKNEQSIHAQQTPSAKPMKPEDAVATTGKPLVPQQVMRVSLAQQPVSPCELSRTAAVYVAGSQDTDQQRRHCATAKTPIPARD
ncbi:unnamed protein product, partial [Gongylonema pulchrum]|uniref:Secreted protein n=1 Tax=Gongylonema pulchrum TaxID=637853 RepID=A0A183EGV5_9BILA